MDSNEINRLLRQSQTGSNSLERLAELFNLPQSGTGVQLPGVPRRPELCANWCRLVAEWLLFLHLLELELPKKYSDFLDIAPFGDETPPLRDLLAAQGTVSMFPTVGIGAPETVRLYLLEGRGSDLRKYGTKHPDFLSGYRIFFQFSTLQPRAFDGNSWQLAAALAHRALSADAETRRQLACYWIATGGCDASGNVTSVELKNKLELRTERNWLLPYDPIQRNARFHVVQTLASAWVWILDQTVHQAKLDFPREVDELHLLVGDSPSPVVSCALQIWPKRLILWASRQTEGCAREIAGILREFGLTDVTLEVVPSNNMPYLEEHFKACFDKSGKVLVLNATGGNRLMGFAAMMACVHSKADAWVVYRDRDAEMYSLQLIRFSEGKWLNGVQSINHLPAERVAQVSNWQRLVGYREKNPDGLRPFLGLKPKSGG